MEKEIGEFTGEGPTGRGNSKYPAEAPQTLLSETSALMGVWPGSRQRRSRECGWKGRLGPDLEEL